MWADDDNLMNLVLKRVPKMCTPCTYATTDNYVYIQLDKVMFILLEIWELYKVRFQFWLEFLKEANNLARKGEHR